MSRVALITGWVLAFGLAWVAWEGAKSAQEARQNARAIATQLDAMETALRASRENAAAHAQAINKLTKERDDARGELLYALQDAPEWSSGAIPSGVYDSLSGPKAPSRPVAP